MNCCIMMIFLFGAATPSVSDNPFIGTWVYHEKWESFSSAVSDLPPKSITPGAVIRFCDDGRFLLVSGYLYRQGTDASMGVSDGLKIFKGEWILKGQSITVKYRLKSYELSWNGAENARNEQIIEKPVLSAKGMEFRYYPYPDIEDSSMLLFINERNLDFKIDNDSFSCASK